MQNKKLDVGEKYLSVYVLGQIKLRAFKNKNKKEGSKEPDYIGDGIAVWVSTKTENKAEVVIQNEI